MSSRGRTSQTFAPVGDTLYNGMDSGGARIYPLSTGLAIRPSSQFSDYIGSGQGLPVAPPNAALSGTTGVGGGSPVIAAAMTKPFGRNSPLPWVIAGLFGAVFATHMLHYTERKH